MKDYYHILGVPRTASNGQIRKAYRAVAKKHHPDASKDADASIFKEASEAYEVLSNDGKRMKYDALSSGSPMLGDINNLFNAFAGGIFSGGTFSSFGGMRSAGRRFSRNQKAVVQVRMDEAYLGTRISFDVQRMRECATCSGVGMEPSAGASCQYCSGSGRILGGMATCASCRGTGKKVVACGSCDGTGGHEEQSRMEVNLPRRTRSGSSIVLKGQGNLSADGTRGDFLVVVTYDQSFESVDLLPDGGLLKQVKVPWDAALMGEDFVFKLFNSCPSDERIRLDSSLPNGWVYVIKGGGMAVGRDLLIKVWYVLPANIKQKSRRAIARAIRNAEPSGVAGQDTDGSGHA